MIKQRINIIKHNIIYKLSEFFRLNVIALRLNNVYKYNIFLLMFIFLCIISSIIFRSNVLIPYINNDASEIMVSLIKIITETTSPLKGMVVSNYYNIFISILGILSTIYALKLIFDIICRCIQAYKIIPEFIKWSNDKKDIKSIMTLYYLQNIFFILLSLWILYIILTKLNLVMDNIYIFIISFGIISSLIFINYYPLHDFNNPLLLERSKDYPFYIYLIIIIFLVFYMFVFPLIMINMINSEKFINYILKDSKEFNTVLKYIEPNYMNNSNRRLISNNTIDNSGNTIEIVDSENLEVSGNNSIINRDNRIQVIPRNAPPAGNGLQQTNITNHFTQFNVAPPVMQPTTPEGMLTQSTLPSEAMLSQPQLQSNNPFRQSSSTSIINSSILPQKSMDKINFVTNKFITLFNTTNKFNINEFIDKLDKLVKSTQFNTIERDHIKLNVLKLTINQLNNGEAVLPYYLIENTNKTNYNNYTSLNRQITSLCYHWKLENMLKIDNYYLNKEYIKMILNGSVHYCHDALSIIYPNHHYYNKGPRSKFINLYEFEYKLEQNNIYYQRIIEISPNLYNLENQPNLLYYMYPHNINENKWLYSHNILEYLTDSKVIIRIDVNNTLSYQSSLGHLIHLISTQPLNELVFNDSSSNKVLLIQYLMEQQLYLNSYYITNIDSLGY